MAPGSDEVGDDSIPHMRDDSQSGADVDLLDALGVQTANPSDIERTLAASLQVLTGDSLVKFLKISPCATCVYIGFGCINIIHPCIIYIIYYISYIIL